jgi:KDO2-lipid IV(A) lauroyltransferase
VTIRDRHYFDQQIDAGKPVILLAPHFVAMEIAGLILAPERHMLSMYQTIRNPLVDTLIRRSRSRFGGIMIERKADMRQVVKLVRGGSPFYYLPDQDPGSSDKVFAPFFGIQTAVTPGLSRFARLSKAAVSGKCRTSISGCTDDLNQGRKVRKVCTEFLIQYQFE